MRLATIKSFTKLGKRKTLDLEVNHPDHNFYAEGLVTSNSHSYAYGTCTYSTTYCKVHYPQQFFLALLRMAQHEPDPFVEIAKISQELPLFNIRLLPPDLIKSDQDFSIEGKDLRFGISAIKGISEKTAESLNTFRGKTYSNKFEVFFEAKEAGLNIGNLCALIQAGCLDSFGTERSLLVLEAQVFNQLTPKEKLLVIPYGQSFSYDILKLLKAVGENKLLTDKGKPIISEKRLGTLRQKYQDYKKIYDHNCKHRKFCHWFFERKLLGYSYSQKLREVFKDPKEKFSPLLELISLDDGAEVCIVGVVTECVKSKSKKTENKYLRIHLSDEGGKTTVLMMDNKKEKKMTNYLENHKMPKEDEILVITGKKNGDIVFAENVKSVDTTVFMRLSEVKD